MKTLLIATIALALVSTSAMAHKPHKHHTKHWKNHYHQTHVRPYGLIRVLKRQLYTNAHRPHHRHYEDSIGGNWAFGLYYSD